jgi:brefeldin A-inhibited guanine nucleotide-exchange protein
VPGLTRHRVENVVAMASDLMKTITANYFVDVVRNGTLQDFISCLVEFAKNKRFAKTSYVPFIRDQHSQLILLCRLTAVELLKLSITKISENIAILTSVTPVDNTSNGVDDPALKYWFPVYFGLYEITMSSELEVRTRSDEPVYFNSV